MVTSPLIKYHAYDFGIPFYVCVTSFPNDYVNCFNHLYNFRVLILYLALLNLYLRDPSLERKASFFLKWFLMLPLEFTFATWVHSEC